MTHVDLSECESILRNYYHIPSSSILTFLQIEIENGDSKSLINQVEYQAYDGNNKTFLNLSLCEGVNIDIYYSIKNNSLASFSLADQFQKSGIDIFNINDSFFNDICYPYSNSNNDLILEDRIKDIYQNYSLCEAGCTYNKIDLDNLIIICECKVKNNVSMTSTPIKLEKSESSSTNFEVIKCYNLVFSLKGKMDNVGFWILGLFSLMHCPILLYYFYKGIKPVKGYIFNEMEKYGYINKNKPSSKNSKKFKNKNKIKHKIKNKSKIIRNIDNQAPPKIKNKNNKNKINKKFVIKNLKIINNSSAINLEKSNSNIISNIKTIDKLNKKKEKEKERKKNEKKEINKKPSKKLKKTKKATPKKIAFLETQSMQVKNNNQILNEKNKNLKNYSLININLNLSKNKKYFPPDSYIILNNYTFEEALKYDHRALCVIFYIFILSKQIFFHTFLFRSPLELFSLRLCLFLFIISSDLSLNALFYFNNNISKKYRHSKNIFLFAFSDNTIIIFLSTFVGFILLTFLSKLSNSTSSIRNVFKKEEEKMKKDKNYKVTLKRKKEILFEIEEILQKYKIKIIVLIIIELILMLFFWYFVTAFCHVYVGTQTSWLLDSCLSIIIRAIIELLISFLLAKIYRISVAGESYCLYKFVMFLYNFG